MVSAAAWALLLLAGACESDEPSASGGDGEQKDGARDAGHASVAGDDSDGKPRDAAVGGSRDAGDDPAGSEAGATDSQPMTASIGPSGGTVVGPNGAQVVVPAGALEVDTLIGIEQTSEQAPDLPTGFVSYGPVFAFTPHGIHFAVPVTVTVPFDANALPSGMACMCTNR